MLKICVIGAGHLGKIHIKCIKLIDDFELIGFYDTNQENSRVVEKEYNVKYFSDLDELISKCDVVDIVTPTLHHYNIAKQSLKLSKHLFIEKPITKTIQEAEELVALMEEANVKIQVGHVERFNPAFVSVINQIESPKFIEIHRLAEFNPRGTDVPVILDLMIHDIDIVLSIINSKVKNIKASGVAVVSDTADIANARIEFDNGCVANLTSSRISLKNMRKLRFFQKNAYITVDLLEKKSEIISIKDAEIIDDFGVYIDLGNKGKKEIIFDKPNIVEINAIKEELHLFAQSIINDTMPIVTAHDGLNALKIATEISNKIDNSIEIL